jgi:hypothetical protein
MRALKAVRLLSLLPKHPVEIYDRVMTVIQVNKERRRTSTPTSNTVNFVDALNLALGVSIGGITEILAENELHHIEKNVSDAITNSKGSGPFDLGHCGDFLLARSIYVICRLLSPNIVIETGVAYGVTSAFTLQALAVNNKGTLFSIDLPPLSPDADEHVGAFIPPQLRGRWRLKRGPTKRILPSLLPPITEVDLFVHDSLHTYHNMSFEFESIWGYLRPGGVLVADDVGLNDAFRDFAGKVIPAFCAVVNQKDKDALFGILVKRA